MVKPDKLKPSNDLHGIFLLKGKRKSPQRIIYALAERVFPFYDEPNRKAGSCFLSLQLASFIFRDERPVFI